MTGKIEKILEADRRKELMPGDRLRLPFHDCRGEIYIREVKIKGKLAKGEGSTCLAYEAEELLKDGVTAKVILKEFYPNDRYNSLNICRDEEHRMAVDLSIKADPRYQARLRQFERGCRIQEELSSSDVMEVVVRQRGWVPYGECGDSSYSISDIHKGQALKLSDFQKMDDKIELMLMVTELMDILHDHEYLFVDFCPENLLWIQRPKAVMILDTDSILDLKDVENIRREDLSHRPEYDPREMKLLKGCIDDFDSKKRNYLDLASDSYRLGVLFFQLLFGRFPEAAEKENFLECWETLKAELSLDEESAEKIGRILSRCLSEKRRRRPAMTELMEALKELQRGRKNPYYVPKKEIALANADYLCSHLLEQYPLFEYERREDGKRILDLAIVGTGPMREAMLQVTIPCAQMLDTRLNVRIVAKDADRFWEEFSSDRKNPELRRTVACSLNGEFQYDGSKAGNLVEEPMAYISLYTDDSDEALLELQKKENPGYFLLIHGSDRDNVRQAEILATTAQRTFIAFMDRSQMGDVTGKKKVDLCPLNGLRESEQYQEARVKSHLSRMGLLVHRSYCRGNDPRVKSQDIREQYWKDAYIQKSSERSALHGIYKLKSIDIDWKAPDAARQYYEKVLDGKEGEVRENFNRLAALEHLSWSAFMVMTGARSVDQREDFRKYAYIGNNDWKNRSDPAHVGHPILKAARPGKGLLKGGWENLTEEEIIRLDPLDQWSLILWQETDRIIRERKSVIEEKLSDLKREIDALQDPDLSEHVRFLGAARDKCLARETSARKIWKEAFGILCGVCQEKISDNRRVEHLLEDLGELMRPLMQFEGYHDYKDSDEDVIRGIPRLLMADEEYAGKSAIIKPMSQVMWKNLFSTLMIEPTLLILIVEDKKDKEKEAEYQEFLENRGLETKLLFKTVAEFLGMKRSLGMIFVDETGVRPVQIRAIRNSPYVQNAGFFEIENRELVVTSMDGNHFVETLKTRVELSVQEAFQLFGAKLTSEEHSNHVTELLPTEYKGLWSLYCEAGGGKRWHMFCEMISALERSKTITLPLDPVGAVSSYETSVSLEWFSIRRTGLDQLLEDLKKKEFIRSYAYTEEECPAIQFSTAYSMLALALMRMVRMAEEEPQKHAYRLQCIEDSQVLVRDQSLYISGWIFHELDDIGGKTIYRDEFMQDILSRLNWNYKNQVFQNLTYWKGKSEEGQDGLFVSFRYHSAAVRETLRLAGGVLEALIYHECKRLKIFDDIRMNVNLVWPDGEVKNELDVVGTRNARVYFISAKLCIPIKEHLEEVYTLARRFGVETLPILVSAHGVTGKNFKTGEDHPDRPYAVENRSRGLGMGYLGRDDVYNLDENRKPVILVGESIRRYVE